MDKISQIVDENIKGINIKNLILPYKNFEKSERVTQIQFLRKKKEVKMNLKIKHPLRIMKKRKKKEEKQKK